MCSGFLFDFISSVGVLKWGRKCKCRLKFMTIFVCLFACSFAIFASKWFLLHCRMWNFCQGYWEDGEAECIVVFLLLLVHFKLLLWLQNTFNWTSLAVLLLFVLISIIFVSWYFWSMVMMTMMMMTIIWLDFYYVICKPNLWRCFTFRCLFF